MVEKKKAKVEPVVEGPKPPSIAEFFQGDDEIALALDMSSMNGLVGGYVKQIKDEMNNLKPDSTPEDRAAFKKRICYVMMELRRMNRLSQYRNKLERDKVAEERQKVDGKYLQLQNVIHEVQHLYKEVQRCLEFKSAHEKIELVSTEEFYQKAPKAISKPEITKTDSHQQRLAQLSWELEERKQLESTMGSLDKESAELMTLVRNKKKELNALKPKIDKILEASRPVQTELNMKYEETEEQRKLSAYLHPPLFYLFLQARAYQEILDDDIDVTIGGNLKVAMKWKEPETEFHKVEEEEEGRSSGRRRRTVSDKVDQQVNHLLQTHPLHVKLVISCKDDKSITLTVASMPLLKAVNIECQVNMSNQSAKPPTTACNLLSSSSLLTNLFPNDDGTECPNSTGAKKLKHFGVDISEHVKSVGYLFKWVHSLCGMKSWGNTTDSDDQIQGCNFLQDIVCRIRNRFQARLSLQMQITNLEGLGVVVPTEATHLFPSKILSKLTSWKSLTYEDFKCHPATQFIGDNECLSEEGWYLSCNVERGQAKLVALIHIGIAYPEDAPFFVLLLKWNGMRYSSDYNPLRLLEEKINVGCVEEWQGPRDQLLTVQIQMLLSRLDILLETESSMASSSPFPMDHLLQRKNRGPSREFPLNFDPTTNSFQF